MSGPALLRATLREQRGRAAGAAALLGAHQAFEALVPVTVGAALDAAIEPSDGDALVLWGVLLVVLFAFLSAAYRPLVVAHRLTQAARADRIVVLDGGRVAEQGGCGQPGRPGAAAPGRAKVAPRTLRYLVGRSGIRPARRSSFPGKVGSISCSAQLCSGVQVPHASSSPCSP